MCENGLPVEKYFDLCANYILEYELMRHGGIISEISSEENKTSSVSKTKNINQNIESQDKSNLGVKNESLKNN